jgi:hypothetical protein
MADIEEVVAAGALELPHAVVWLERILGSDSPVVGRLSRSSPEAIQDERPSNTIPCIATSRNSIL